MKEKKDWTVMIYMVGDNNLSIDMVYALEELQKKVVTKENDKINLFVYYENNSPEIPTMYCDFTDIDNPIYQYSNEINEKFSINNALEFPNSVAICPMLDFVDWCVNKVEYTPDNKIQKGRKSNNYALILSGHTMGFLSMGLLKEETTNVSMTMPSLLKGLEMIKDKIIGQKLALLGFDSCVMSMFEVGQQFKAVADTMIASEGSIPNAGWSYAEILGSLVNENTKSDVKVIAADFVKKYVMKQSAYSIGGVSVDMSAWDLSKIDDLNLRVEQFAKKLLLCFEDETSVIYRQMKRVILQVHFECQTYMYDQNIDLGDFCSLIARDIESLQYEQGFELSIAYQDLYDSVINVISAIYECVLLSGFSGGEYQYSTGISMFFPWSLPAYKVAVYDYEQLAFVKDTDAGKLWNQFLQKYLSEVSLRKLIQHENQTIQNQSHLHPTDSQMAV